MALSLSLSLSDDNDDPGIMKPTRGNDLLLDVNHIVAQWIMVRLIRPPHVNPASINNPVKWDFSQRILLITTLWHLGQEDVNDGDDDMWRDNCQIVS